VNTTTFITIEIDPTFAAIVCLMFVFLVVAVAVLAVALWKGGAK
jgi:hypothetical protein